MRFVPQVGHSGLISYCGLSADGSIAMSAGASVKIWETKTGAVLRTLGWSGGATELTDKSGSLGLTAAALSPDGRLVAFAASFTLQLNDLETGEEVARYKSTEEGWWWTSVAFSPDGKLLAANEHFQTELIDVEHWKVVRTLENPKAYDKERPLIFSADGRWLRAGDLTFEVSTGKVAPPNAFPKGPRDGDLTHAFSQDGKSVFVVTDGGDLELRDAQSGAVTKKFLAKFDSFRGEAIFSPDGQLVYESKHNNKGTRVWDVASGMLARTFPKHEVPMALAPDGKRLVAYRGIFGEPEVINTETGAVLLKLAPSGVQASERWLSFAADGSIIRISVSYLFDKPGRPMAGVTRFEAWDGKTGALLRSQSLEGEDRTFAVKFSADGKTALLTQWKRFSLWDLSSFTRISATDSTDVGGGSPVTFLGDKGRVVSLGYSHDPRNPAEFFFWDLASGRNIRTITTALSTSPVLAVHPFGRLALVGSQGGLVTLWDLERGTILRTLEGHTDHLSTLAFSPDGKYALSASRDGTARFWRLDTGASLVLLSSGGEWLIHDADGNFDGSRRGGELVAGVQGRKVFSVEQLAAHNNRPDLLLGEMGLASPEVIAHFRARFERRLKKLGLSEGALAGRFDAAPSATIVGLEQQGKFADLSFELTDSTGLKALYIWVNGVPIFGGEGKPVSGTSGQFKERVELTTGPNRIEVSASNQSGAEALRDFRVVEYQPVATGNLYYLGFGVSKYKNSNLDLAYAHKDVLDLGKVLQATTGKFDQVYVRTYVNDQVTTANIRAAKDFLRDAKTDDTVVVFVAGHGTHSEDEAADYYFVTHDVEIGRLRETAAPFELIEDLLQDIAPRRKLLLMDTCESGDRDDDAPAPAIAQAGARTLRSRGIRGVKLASAGGPSSAEARRALRRVLEVRDRYLYNDLGRRTGAVVFSSSRGAELSYEQDALQNGVFTAQLKAALQSTAADRDNNGLLSTDELRDFVSAEVAKLTNDLQHPSIDRDNVDIHLGLPISDPNVVILPQSARDAIGKLDDPRCTADATCKIFQTGCNQGKESECSTLGNFYLTGYGVIPKDPERARNLYQALCDATEGRAVLACVSLADFYWKGTTVAKDPARGLRLVRRTCPLPAGAMACSLAYQHGDKAFAFSTLATNCAASDWEACTTDLYLLMDSKKLKEALRIAATYKAGALGGDEMATQRLRGTRDSFAKLCTGGKSGTAPCAIACELGDANSCTQNGLAKGR